MLLGIGTYSFPWAIEAEQSVGERFLFAKKLLAFAATHEIRFVQFGDNLPLHEWSIDYLKEFKDISDQQEIQIQVGTRRLVADHIRLYISLAGFFGSSFLRVVIDDKDYHPATEDIITQINTLLPDLKSNQVKLAIENHDRFSSNTLEKIIVDTDPSLVGICLDTANSLGAGEGIEHVVNTLAPYTVNLHVKDFTIQRVEHKMGFLVEGAAAGEGMLDIPWLIAALKTYPACETATLELWSNGEADIKSSIINEKIKVEKSIQYLKTVIA